MTTKKFIARPDTMVIGVHTYHIEWLTHDEWSSKNYDEAKCGLHDGSKQLISMRLITDCNESFFQETLFHELLHAAWWNSGVDQAHLGPMDMPDREEYVVGLMSPAMTLMLKQNPHVVDYIFKADGDRVR